MLTTKEFGNINKLTEERKRIEDFLKEDAIWEGLVLFRKPELKFLENI